MKPRRVHLLATCAPDAPGSMLRYADLVETALRRGAPDLEVFRHHLAPRNEGLSRWPSFLRNRLHHLTVHARLRRFLRTRPDGVFHLLDGSHGYLLHLLPPGRALVTCHDLIPLRQALGGMDRRPHLPARILIRRSASGLARATRVFAVSSSTAADALLLAGVPEARLRVLPDPLDERWLRRIGAPRPPAPPEPFVLHVGHGGFYKNRPGVLRVFARIAEAWNGRLVFAGAPLSSAERETAASLGLSARVDSVPNPDDDQLAHLYQTASLLLFPSLIEGFGWPPLEALACGCPALASAVGGLPDVLGAESPCLFAAGDEGGMASAALRLLRDPASAASALDDARQRLERLTPDALALVLAEEYRRVAAGEAS